MNKAAFMEKKPVWLDEITCLIYILESTLGSCSAIFLLTSKRYKCGKKRKRKGGEGERETLNKLGKETSSAFSQELWQVIFPTIPSGEEMVDERGVPVQEDWSIAPEEDKVRFSLSGVTPRS